MQAKPLPQLLELLVAPEEAVAVLLGEGRHADIGAGGPRPRRGWTGWPRTWQSCSTCLARSGGSVPSRPFEHGQSGR